MTRHDRLLRRYAEELAAAKETAEAWWQGRLQSDRAPGDAGDEAEWAFRQRWADGAASHPRVLAVVRRYWLACDALNLELEEERRGRKRAPADFPHRLDVSSADEDEEAEDDEPEEENQVDPHVFVLESLIDGEHDELAEFLANLSYWPIGLDDQDRFV